jgi:hypothetical protein
MDLIISSVWWIVGLVAAAFASVFAALARCAVAELFVRAAARLHTAQEEVRAELVEEWLRYLQDMRPSERPAHAATLLWSGLKARKARKARPAIVNQVAVHAEPARMTLTPAVVTVTPGTVTVVVGPPPKLNDE